MSDMLAGRLNVETGAFSLTRVPIPDPGHGQVRIKVAAAGVCLSDLHLIQGVLTPAWPAAPEVTLGHEVAGVVDALGPGVAQFAVGQRVVLAGGQLGPDAVSVLTRGVDDDGGWAEYALAEASTVIPIPDSLPFDQACIIPDAVSTPWAAITSTGQVKPGESGVSGVSAGSAAMPCSCSGWPGRSRSSRSIRRRRPAGGPWSWAPTLRWIRPTRPFPGRSAR
jgi:NADPH:quinone reductase-like Zn-dependent oxidoreductase